MADKKISALTAATTPLAGTEVLPIVQSGATVKVSIDNLTTGKAVTVGSLNDAGNLTFTGTGNRITGDFSNATVANRVAFQTSTTNGNTFLAAIPNGTGTAAGLLVYNNSDPTNAAFISSQLVGTTEARINSGITGTGTYLPMTFYTGGSERVRVDTSGNVGVGVVPSAWGTASSTRAIELGAGSLWSFSTTTLLVNQNAYFDGTNYVYKTTSQASRYAQTGGEHQWFNAPSGTAGNTVSFTRAMTLDASGNLLVGTTTYGGKITSVQSSSLESAIYGAHLGTTDVVRGIIALTPNYSGNDGYLYLGNAGGVDKFYVRTSGNVQNTNNSYGAISDVKLKENIVDTTPKLEKLNQVRIVNFNFIGDEQKQLGVIAQELELIFPGMIEETPDRDEEGADLGTTTKSVKYSVFVPMLIKAIQEQQALIQSLTTRLEALEA
jgi:hypothetical protein